MTTLTCDSCGGTVGVENAQFRGIPMVYRLCKKCRNAGAIPYDLLCTFVWLGYVSIDDRTAQNIALYHGVSMAEFTADCANFADKMNETLGE